MMLLFVILIFIVAFVLGVIVLIQNPKGGGLTGSFAGISTQFMGVKQTTDVLEKGTWLFAGIIGLLCLLSTMFIPVNGVASSQPDVNSKASGAPAPATRQQPSNTVPLQPTAPVQPAK